MNKLINLLSQSTAVEAFGISLLHSLWQGALLAILLWLVLQLLRNAPAQLRYYCGIITLLFLCLAFFLTFFLQYDELAATPQTLAFEEISIEDVDGGKIQTEEGISLGIFQKFEQFWNTSSIWLKAQFTHIFIIWCLGFVFYSGRFLLGLTYLQRMKKEKSLISIKWVHTMESLQEKIRLRKKVRLISSHRIAAPLTFGWLKPIIIVPASMLTQLPMEQVESLLLHELVHIQQRDYLISLLQSTTELLFFFNPGYWLISSCLNNERENACDDRVVATSENPITYARALSSLAQLCYLKNPTPALASANNQQQLLLRIKRIVTTSKTPEPMRPFFKNSGYLLGPIAIFCLFLALFTLEVKGDIQSPPDIEVKKTTQAIDSVKKQNVTKKYTPDSFLVLMGGSFQVATADSKGNLMLTSLTADTIFVEDRNLARAQGTVKGKTTYINPEKIRQENQTNFVYNGTLQKLTTHKNGDLYLSTIQGDSVNATFKNNQLDRFSGSGIKGKNISHELPDTLITGNNKDASVTIRKKVKNADPLILLIDGKTGGHDPDLNSEEERFKETVKKGLASGKVVDNLEGIPAESIGSITVVKKDALAIFGEQGKNGVIIITLKQEAKKPSYKPEAGTHKEITSDPLILVMEHEPKNTRESSKQDIKSIAETALSQGIQITNTDDLAVESIASIQVFKDQQATYFGEKAKGGVILIYLKQGHKTPGKQTLPVNEDLVVYPNPAGNLVKIKFRLHSTEKVKITAHDTAHNLIATISNGPLAKGTHEFEWDASQQKPGIYVISLQKGSHTQSQRVKVEQ